MSSPADGSGAKAGVAPGRSAEATGSRPIGRRRARRPVVLVADDDAELREALGELLESDGFEVLSASNGAQALERALEAHPDVVLLDQRMPRMTGTEVLQELRSRGFSTPVVLVTAADDIDALSSLVGAELHLGKPFDVDELLAIVQRALDR